MRQPSKATFDILQAIEQGPHGYTHWAAVWAKDKVKSWLYRHFQARRWLTILERFQIRFQAEDHEALSLQQLLDLSALILCASNEEICECWMQGESITSIIDREWDTVVP